MVQTEPSAAQLREELRAWHEQVTRDDVEEQSFTRTQALRLAKQIEALHVNGIYPFRGQVKVVETHLYQHILIRVLTPYEESGARIATISLDRNAEPGYNLDELDAENIITQAEQASNGDENQFAELVKTQLLKLSLKNLEAFEFLFGLGSERSYSPVVRSIVEELKEGLPHS